MSDDDPLIAEALANLEADDAGAARDAEAALGWLTAGEGLSVLTQERLQHFLWYGLPMKWLTDTDHHRQIVAGLARAFDLLGLPRYAALCRSETTAAVLDAYERSDAEGKKAFLKADIASGIRPPDIDELAWGSVMGMQESAALSSTAEFLELAVSSGDLLPGSSGWKQRQQDLVRAHLTTARIELAGRTLLEAIRDERLETWLEGRRSPTRRRLLEPLAEAVLAPADLTEGVDDPIRPLQWLLGELVDGQPLTQTGNLSRAFVQDAAPGSAGTSARRPAARTSCTTCTRCGTSPSASVSPAARGASSRSRRRGDRRSPTSTSCGGPRRAGYCPTTSSPPPSARSPSPCSPGATRHRPATSTSS